MSLIFHLTKTILLNFLLLGKRGLRSVLQKLIVSLTLSLVHPDVIY